MVFQAGALERFDSEMVFSLKGMGLSIVDDKSRQEVSYISITKYSTCSVTSFAITISVQFNHA